MEPDYQVDVRVYDDDYNDNYDEEDDNLLLDCSYSDVAIQ